MRSAKIKITLALMVAYFLLFFAIQPLVMISAGVWPINYIVGFFYDVYFWSWVGRLDESNIIFEIWTNVGEYWCGRVESCSISSQSNI